MPTKNNYRRLKECLEAGKSSRMPHARHLRIEPLEDRRMLATITVTSLSDNLFPDGLVSLREAIQAANTNASVDGSTAGTVGADTIEFDPSLFNETILLAGELEITETLTIDASALPGGMTIDAQQNSRVLHFTSTSGDLSLNGITVTGGRTVGGNTSQTDSTHSGAGIRFASGGVLTLTNTSVIENGTEGFGASGGGIAATFDSGSVVILDSLISGNFTSNSSATGGGVYVRNADLTLINTIIENNRTTGFQSGGGGLHTRHGTITLNNSTVSGNRTEGSNSTGGGINSYVGNITLWNSTISGNRTAGNISDGAGIRAYGGDLEIRNSTIAQNVASGPNADGGGVSIGAIAPFHYPMLTVQNSIIAANGVATGNTGPDLEPSSSTSLDVDYSLIGNTTDSEVTAGTGTGNLLDLIPQLGPLQDNGGPTYTHATVPGSPAIDAGDPSFDVVSTPVDQRGAPFARGIGARVDMGAYEHQVLAASSFVVTTLADELDYSNADVSLREAIDAADGSVGDDTITFDPSLSGGTILLGGSELEIGNTLTIDGSTLPAGITVDGQQLSRVLRFESDFNDLSLNNLTLRGGKTTAISDGGGGISFSSYGTLSLTSSTVTSNQTTGSTSLGGGIRSTGSLTLIDSSVSGNHTAGDSSVGGGIASFYGTLTITDSTVSGNLTSGESARGGGIWNAGGTLTLTRSTVNGNSTSGSLSHGGGIMSYFGTVSLSSSTVSGNRTTGDNSPGGGVYTNDGGINLNNSTVSGNTTAGANSYGGGIFTLEGGLSLISSTITRNGTTGPSSNGGGILVANTSEDPLFRSQYTIIADNTVALGIAPDLRPDSTSLFDVDRSLIGNTSGSGISETTGLFNRLNVDPMLGPLQNNGGPTLTHLPATGSPAIDVEQLSLIFSFDQRGAPFDREVDDPLTPGAGRDIGAIEVQPIPDDADFDNDGDIDGFDFLTWQRGFPTTYDANDLTEWQSTYGQGSALAAQEARTEALDYVLGFVWLSQEKRVSTELSTELSTDEQNVEVVIQFMSAADYAPIVSKARPPSYEVDHAPEEAAEANETYFDDEYDELRPAFD